MREIVVSSGYVNANGVNYYYEVHGEGEPLLLLHGGLQAVVAGSTGSSSCSRRCRNRRSGSSARDDGARPRVLAASKLPHSLGRDIVKGR